MQDALQTLYRDTLLQLSRSPLHFRPLAEATHRGVGRNPKCGDHLEIALVISGETIQAAAWQGSGCALMTASASLLTDAIHARPLSDVGALLASLEALFAPAEPSASSLQALASLALFSTLRAFPLRQKCARLPWSALAHALHDRSGSVSTES